MTTIGLVYDLRDDYLALGYTAEQVAEFDTLETIDQIDATLTQLGYVVDRVGYGRQLAAAFVNGMRWDLVFSIAEGSWGRSREAQVAALCEMFDQAYVFSDPLTMAATLDKAVAKRIVRDCGIATAPFVILETGAELLDAWLHYPAFVKPLAEGTGKGCELASIAYNEAELRAAALGLIRRFNQPALVEAYLPGREFTVGITGNGSQARVIGVMEIVLNAKAEQGVYSFTNKDEWEHRVNYFRADDDEAGRAAKCALDAYIALGCRDAARLDIRSDQFGTPAFLEVNPIAGLNRTYSDLPMLAAQNGVSYADLLALIVDAAILRNGIVDSEMVNRKATG